MLVRARVFQLPVQNQTDVAGRSSTLLGPDSQPGQIVSRSLTEGEFFEEPNVFSAAAAATANGSRDVLSVSSATECSKQPPAIKCSGRE